MRDAHHKLALGLPHYTCGVVTIGIVAVGNEIHSCVAADWHLYIML